MYRLNRGWFLLSLYDAGMVLLFPSDNIRKHILLMSALMETDNR